MDTMQKISDDIQRYLNLPLHYNCVARTEAYAAQMRKIFSAKICMYEWLTIQCKCLSDGEVTHAHKDSTNCSWKS